MVKLTPLAFGLALMLTQTGIALAHDSASNENTGPSSNNEASVDKNNNISIKIRNDASVSYNINLNLNTGGNTVSHNTTAGDLSSGDISAHLSLTTEINQGGLEDCACLAALLGDPGNNSVSNSHTGPNSSNNASITHSNKVKVDVKNTVKNEDNITIAAHTGGNTVSENTTAGDLRSGNITIGIDLKKLINQMGLGGFVPPPTPPAPSKKEAPAPQKEAPRAEAAALGGALFPAGSSMLILLLGLILAANLAFFRRHPYFVFHSLFEGKVARGGK